MLTPSTVGGLAVGWLAWMVSLNDPGLVSIADLRELGDAMISLAMRSSATVANAKLTSLMLHDGVTFLRYDPHAEEIEVCEDNQQLLACTQR